MIDLLALAGQNTIVALVLALVVWCLTRAWRNPAVAHLLWLFVLIKLVSPPLIGVDWSALRRGSPPAQGGGLADAGDHRQQLDLRGDSADGAYGAYGTAAVRAARSGSSATVASPSFFWRRTQIVVLCLWLAGAVGCALVVTIRVVRFERLLRDALRASERWQRLAREIAGTFGLRNVPVVCYLESVNVPFVWCAGAARRSCCRCGCRNRSTSAARH